MMIDGPQGPGSRQTLTRLQKKTLLVGAEDFVVFLCWNRLDKGV